ncbi:PcfJ domain-containing protein [uncultured Porphyromonas sp.]|uniref:PcfJ domain-containing protein n=1 Tax=uncultured Porphyromonas sp. TaxID=159274 RepID=UPI00262FAD17|nr:PcfJ domain-containing protein [uncultured Porphyromonas sp.]
MEEGQALHHCVFTNEYHLKEKSLILSASIDGKPIETIELSSETMKVIQCRGLMNQDTEYHERIIELVHQNMKQIQSRVA